MDSEYWFDWDDGNEDHILAHGVEPVEVEEALLDPEGFGADAYDVSGEKVRPITARDTGETQKRRYRRRKG